MIGHAPDCACTCSPVDSLTGQEVEILVPGRPPSPNTRRHWWKIAKDDDEWAGVARAAAIDTLRTLPGWSPLARCDVAYRFLVPTHIAHDWDNLISSTKPLTDGLVEAGVLTDDSDRVIRRVAGVEIEYVRGVAATVYRFRGLAPMTPDLGL